MVLDVVGEVFGAEREDFRQRRRDSILRGVAARYLCRYGFLTQREAASVLRMKTGSAVSHQIRRVNDRALKDSRLRGKLKQIERRLAQMRGKVQEMVARETAKRKRARPGAGTDA